MIRLIQDKDFNFIFELYMHPKVNPFLLYEMMTTDEFKPIFDDLKQKEIVYIFNVNGTDIGMFKLYGHTFRCAHVSYLGGVGIHPEFGGKGYGSAMFEEIIELAKSKKVKRLELSVHTENQKAINLYQKHGFEIEGIMRNYGFLVSENKYFDENLMSLILN